MSEAFKWNPVDYSKNSSAQLTWALDLIGKLALKGDESIIDIGCGDGKVTAEIAKHVPSGSVLGIDSSEVMVGFARESFSADAFPNLSFQVMDARALSLRSTFDVVFSNAALHWIVDHRAIIEGVAQIMNPGGRLLFQMGGKGNAQDIIDVLGDLVKTEEWEVFFRDMENPYGFYGPDEYLPWLEAAGLTPVRVQIIEKDMKQNGRAGLLGWMRTTWLPFIQRVPEDMKEQFLNSVIDEYIVRFPLDADGNPHVAMVRLEVEAVKQ